MGDLAIETKDLVKTYGEGDTAVHALKGVSLAVPRGEFVVLLGPSGSGKTTLLNHIGALETPTSGSIISNGVDLGTLDDKERTEYRLNSVGFVFQFYNLVPTLTAKENVAMIAELTDGEGLARTERVLQRVGLGDRMDHFPYQLSGGEQQRVSIARGLVKDPPILLADEPTGALDVESGIAILELLREATTDSDRSLLCVTHNTVIAKMADRVIRLRDGEVISQEQNPHPADPREMEW